MSKWIVIFLGGWLSMAGAETLYDIPLTTIDGKNATLSEYKGKTLLIVNTASKCGYTPQYEGLESLYSKYKSKGLIVLGFPSNDFGAQEPGTNGEIKKFCTVKYKVDFPMFTKAPVKGGEKQPLYKFLTENAPTKGEIKWNFEKFLITPDGKIVARFDSKVKPEELTGDIEKNLPR
jgi:glutathione peroxidase